LGLAVRFVVRFMIRFAIRFAVRFVGRGFSRDIQGLPDKGFRVRVATSKSL
jgi:hypothetical protein